MVTHDQPFVVVVMGVSGTGKSSVAAIVAGDLGIDFIEGDSHHPDSSIEKMSEGIPLDDDDRRPWLHTLATLMREECTAGRSVVLTCSALKRSYRDVLRRGAEAGPGGQALGQIFFLHLHADSKVLHKRMSQRTKHFMPTSLLSSQLASLEPLEDDELGAVVDVAARLEEVVVAAREAIARAR